jgi:hypothetical protein
MPPPGIEPGTFGLRVPPGVERVQLAGVVANKALAHVLETLDRTVDPLALSIEPPGLEIGLDFGMD